MFSGSRSGPHATLDSVRHLSGDSADFDPILDAVGDARYVLLGEASHGTHEFYQMRAELTKRLIRERGFNAIAIEGDWPDAYRVNRYVRGLPGDGDAAESLRGFTRFPQWMWRNTAVVDFIGWLRAHNDEIRMRDDRVGFYGLDLYSLNASMHSVLAYLGSVDTEAAERARKRYACFDHFGGNPQHYGYNATLDEAASCERQAMAQLIELQNRAREDAVLAGREDPDALFAAEQNARLVVNAERYYRSMFESRVSSWNLRDAHMAETLGHLSEHIAARQKSAKIVVWAHNSHLGDARATELGRQGELNLGQLAREQYDRDVVLVGFSTYAGTVTAASDWDEPAKLMRVRPALPGSYEAFFHSLGGNVLIDLTEESPAVEELEEPRLQRAIGVIYRPETERLSHYYKTSLPSQFDFMLHYDQTRAVEPLERAQQRNGEVLETFPSGV